MFRLEEFLLRFRRLAAPPGLAGPAAVAVDRTADITMELGLLLVAIDEIEDEADAVERQASEHGVERMALAENEARRLVADADRRVADVHAAVVGEHHRNRVLETRTLRRRARAEADRIERTAGRHTPELVDRALARLRAMGD
jgi:hypothetical protein